MEADLETKLKEKGLSDSSIKLYLRNLQKLNDGQPVKNLNFLKDTEAINAKLARYKPNTVRSYIIGIATVLSLNKDKKGGKKVWEQYANQMMNLNRSLKAEEATNTKSESQEKNWEDWKAVEAKWTELRDKVEAFKSSATLNTHQYNQLLEFVVLSLYVLLPPRRNDYQKMEIVDHTPTAEQVATNYFDLEGKQFIFNVFKTSKREGQVILAIPESLQSVLQIYLRFHPLLKTEKKFPVAFLVYADGRPFTANNAITRILNKVFGKNISSSMLRHSYLSGKYGDVRQEMKEDAQAMSHSVVTQQTNYVKH